jgi:chorismate mutase/prephenate dehydratase
MYFRHFGAVAGAVRAGLCDYGVLPVENNTWGSVREVYRILGSQEISIVRGYRLKIEHQLLAKPGTSLGDVTEIYSHEQALGQCERFLHTLGDGVTITACLNTAAAARMVSESAGQGAAAISSPECAELYGLQVLKKGIADSEYNYTRFLGISAKSETAPDADRTSLILSLPHKPGSLAGVLSCFAGAGINLLKLESAPIPGRDFEFLFYADIEGSCQDPGIAAALKEVSSMCSGFRVLGSYREE